MLMLLKLVEIEQKERDGPTRKAGFGPSAVRLPEERRGGSPNARQWVDQRGALIAGGNSVP